MKFKILEKCLLEAELPQFMQLVKDWQYCQWNEGNFLRDLPAKWELSFAVYEQEKLIGFCFASRKSDIYYIHLFFLAPEYRGKSLGKQMIMNALTIAQMRNLSMIELRCPATNVAGLVFYKKNGFSIERILNDCVSAGDPDCYLQLKC